MTIECSVENLTKRMLEKHDERIVIGLPRVWLSRKVWEELELKPGDAIYVGRLPHERFYVFLPELTRDKKNGIYLPKKWQVKFGKKGINVFVTKYEGEIRPAKRIQIVTQPTKDFNPHNLTTDELEDFKTFLTQKISMEDELVVGISKADQQIMKKAPLKNIFWKDYDCIAEVSATYPAYDGLLRITEETDIYIGVPRLVNVVALFDFSGSVNMPLAGGKTRKYFMILSGKNLITTKRKSTDDSLIALLIFRAPYSEISIGQIKFDQDMEDRKSECTLELVEKYLDILFYEVEWRDMELAFESVLEVQESTKESTDLLDPLLMAAKALKRASLAKDGRCSSVVFVFSDGCHNHCMTDKCSTDVSGKKLEDCCLGIKKEVLDYCSKNDIRISSIFAARPEEKYTNRGLLQELSSGTNGAFLDLSPYLLAKDNVSTVESKVASAVAQFIINHSSKTDLLLRGVAPEKREVTEVHESLAEQTEKDMVRDRLNRLGTGEKKASKKKGKEKEKKKKK